MNATMMISVQIGEPITSEVITLSQADGQTLLDTLKTCRGLMPGEVAQRLGAVISGMQSLDVVEPPPPGSVDMTPPIDGIPETPPPEPVEGTDPA